MDVSILHMMFSKLITIHKQHEKIQKYFLHYMNDLIREFF